VQSTLRGLGRTVRFSSFSDEVVLPVVRIGTVEGEGLRSSRGGSKPAAVGSVSLGTGEGFDGFDRGAEVDNRGELPKREVPARQ
jgi:hypothetical protein